MSVETLDGTNYGKCLGVLFEDMGDKTATIYFDVGIRETCLLRNVKKVILKELNNRSKNAK